MNNHEIGIPKSELKRIVIIGAGFAGLELARKIDKSVFQVVILDKENYHTFQPLLYQVATGGIEPDSIAYPIRNVFNHKQNKTVFFRLVTVEKIIPQSNSVLTNEGEIGFDFLVIATGSKPNFYGNTNLESQAFVLKSVTNALDIRSYLFQTIEQSLVDPEKRIESIVVAGGGPTGIEVAGALADLRNHVFPNDYPEIDFSRMMITLGEAGKSILSAMSEKSSMHAGLALRKMGVEVVVNKKLKEINNKQLFFDDGSSMKCDMLIWCAGVKGNNLPGLSEQVLLNNGRYKTDVFNRIAGYSNIFAIGDVGAIETEGAGHPMLAPVAMQQAKNLASNFNSKEIGSWKKFRYIDKGVMATIGRNKAVVDLGYLKMHGFIAWLTWVFVHLMTLVGFRNRMVVFINWLWNYLAFDSAIRLIIRPYIRKKKNE